MIELSSTDTTTIGFKINIEGNSQDPKARFILKINDDFSMLFPCRIFEDKAIVNVPALSFVSTLGEEVLEAFLEVYVDESFFVPWYGSAVIKKPKRIEAKLEGNIDVTYKKSEINTFEDFNTKNEIEEEVNEEIEEEVEILEEQTTKRKSLKEQMVEDAETFGDFLRKKGLK